MLLVFISLASGKMSSLFLKLLKPQQRKLFLQMWW